MIKLIFMKKFYFISVIYFMCLTNFAHAYLDPGTGSIILQALLGAIAAVTSYFVFGWNKVKTFFKKIFKKNKTK
tara:strand:- start:816 stop:1037 length:222 start_codon:yes stop_codon:yes gene_type:complete